MHIPALYTLHAAAAISVLKSRFSIANDPHGAEVPDVQSPRRDSHNRHVAVVGVLVTHGEPFDAAAEVLFQLPHDLLRPRPQVQVTLRVLLGRVW